MLAPGTGYPQDGGVQQAQYPVSQGQAQAPYVPQMRQYQPAQDPGDRASMLSQSVHDGDTFSFPADRDFWNNLTTQVRLYPGAMDPPHFHVDATHTDESIILNQEFLRRFVAGWERANPHSVKLSGPQGGTTFHASEEFWNRFVNLAEQRARERASRGETVQNDIWVQSGQFAPVQTNQQDWRECCAAWEADQAQSRHREMMQPPPAAPAPASYRTRDGPTAGPNEMLLSQQNQEIDRNRGELAQKDLELQSQMRTIQELQAQVHSTNMQLQELTARDAQVAAERGQAISDAERYQSEVVRLRGQMDAMDKGWQGERASLESRLRRVEQQFKGLMDDVGRDTDSVQREIASKDAEIVKVKNDAQERTLRRELELREMMQEEICKQREHVSREVAGQLQTERMGQQVCELRDTLQEVAARTRAVGAVPSPCGPSVSPFRGQSQQSDMSVRIRPACVPHSDLSARAVCAVNTGCPPPNPAAVGMPHSPWRARQESLAVEVRELRAMIGDMTARAVPPTGACVPCGPAGWTGPVQSDVPRIRVAHAPQRC
eukprot:TRINITY_DN4473_c0_g1_i1.p1 TRINITY_DN4473_c0_g1~~TRINITY_DN4473_c0_g1_i1.p1  ORF type:complete len:547 (+),score=150.56 TRINITY_DN4473_c0_g1_i1:181-1821(+)